MRKYYVETVRSVADFREPTDDGKWEAAREFVPPENEFRSALKDDLGERGIYPKRSREFKLIEVDGFVEFDSGNIGHAGAIYGATFEGPDGLVAILEKEIK